MLTGFPMAQHRRIKWMWYLFGSDAHNVSALMWYLIMAAINQVNTVTLVPYLQLLKTWLPPERHRASSIAHQVDPVLCDLPHLIPFLPYVIQLLCRCVFVFPQLFPWCKWLILNFTIFEYLQCSYVCFVCFITVVAHTFSCGKINRSHKKHWLWCVHSNWAT